MNTDNFTKLTVELKEAIDRGDNENVHGAYDALILAIAKRNEPALVRKLTRMVKDIPFWYA